MNRVGWIVEVKARDWCYGRVLLNGEIVKEIWADFDTTVATCRALAHAYRRGIL